MRKTVKALVAVLVILVAFANTARADEVLVHHPNTMGLVARDTLSGGLAGSAVAGGIIIYNMGIKERSDYDWGRTLAWGAGIGLAVGLVWGVVDVTTAVPYGSTTPLAMRARDGQSLSLDLRTRDAPGTTLAPVAMGRF